MEQIQLPGFEQVPFLGKRLKGAMVAFRRIRVKREIVTSCLLDLDKHWERKVVVTRSGKTLITYKPSRELKKIQWKIVRYIDNVNLGRNRTILPVAKQANEWMDRKIVPTHFATAFERGNSIVWNALAHLDMRSSVSFDLKRAFENVKRKHVLRFLLRLGFPKDVAWVFSKLLTYEGRLQRGSSVSAKIFNLLLSRLDTEIARVVGAKAPLYVGRDWVEKERKGGWLCVHGNEFVDGIIGKRVSYTRYGDDICVSSAEEVFPSELVTLVRNVILSQGFQIRESKTLVCSGGVLELPGVVIVGNVLRPRRAYLVRLARSISERTITEEELHGHLAFICSFPRRSQKGAYSFLKKIVGKNTHLPVFRKPNRQPF
jgi:RNA-directed DNA polymerase